MLADLQFNEATHTYTVGGRVWPSVTQILEPLNDFESIPSDLLRSAADFGTHVHAAIHLENQCVLDIESLDPALVPYVSAWSAFIAHTGAVIIDSERRVMNSKLRYCGTLDVIAVIDGARELIEVKSTAAIPRTAGPQTAGYAAAIAEPRIRRRVVQLKTDGSYRSERLTSGNDWTVFLSCLNLWSFKNAA